MMRANRTRGVTSEASDGRNMQARAVERAAATSPGATPSRVASSGTISKNPPVAASARPVPSQTALSTRPIPPPTTASMGGSRIFPFIPGLRSSRATRTPPTADLSGRSGAFNIAAGPRASDAGVHARTHSPVSLTNQAASAPLAHSTTISRTETRTRQLLPFMGMARILQPYVANAERRHGVRAAADLAQRRMRRYQGRPGLEGDARRTLPAPRGRRARPSPARGPDAPRRRRAGAPA